MKFCSLLAVLALGSLCTVARGNVTFEIDGDLVSNSTNVGIPNNSAFFVVVDTTGNGFALPTLGHAVTGNLWGGSADDIVIASFAAAGFAGFNGTQQSTVSNLDYTSFTNATVAAGEHVGLFWFPTLTYNGSGVLLTNGATYGYFDTASTGSDAASWVLPADLTSDKVFTFATSNAQFFSAGNDVASYGTVVPEPSLFAWFGGISALGLAGCWRRRKTA